MDQAKSLPPKESQLSAKEKSNANQNTALTKNQPLLSKRSKKQFAKFETELSQDPSKMTGKDNDVIRFS